MTADYPRLRYLIASYYFPQYSASGDTEWTTEFEEFLRSETPSAINELLDDLDRFLTNGDNDAEIGAALDSWGCAFDFDAVGATLWLEALRARAQAFVQRRSV